jgi:hypothetical protein
MVFGHIGYAHLPLRIIAPLGRQAQDRGRDPERSQQLVADLAQVDGPDIADWDARERPIVVLVSAAICLFIGFGIWLFGISAIARAARVEQIRTLTDVMLMVRLVVPVSALLVIAAGLTMALTAWGLQTGWIAVALGGLVIVGSIGTWVIDPKVRAMATLAHTLPDGPLPATLVAHSRDILLRLTRTHIEQPRTCGSDTEPSGAC